MANMYLDSPGFHFDGPGFRRHLECAAHHYEKTAPTVAEWIDHIYRSKDADITLVDVSIAVSLYDDGQWEQPNYAANRIYKHMEMKGMDTTGQAGF